MHPRHSVGHLHIHCCLRNLWTANGNALNHKNTELSDVIQCLNSKRLTDDEPTQQRKVAVHLHPQEE